MKRIFIIICGVIFGLSLILNSTNSFAQAGQDTLIYTVKRGDFLTGIATEYGLTNFWIPIYEANKDQISDPDLIYPDQKFIIPPSVTQSDRFIDPQAKNKSKSTELTAEQKKQLEAFRKAFNSLKEKEKLEENKKQEKKANYNGLEFGGLVINETRSKMGSDFFNVFYKYWQAPKGAGNFILKISEQPIPSLGTLVSVKIDDYTVFKSRLQPRYEFIEKLAKQAVIVSYQRLQQRINTSNELTIY